jgi:hypothetical protein
MLRTVCRENSLGASSVTPATCGETMTLGNFHAMRRRISVRNRAMMSVRADLSSQAATLSVSALTAVKMRFDFEGTQKPLLIALVDPACAGGSSRRMQQRVENYLAFSSHKALVIRSPVRVQSVISEAPCRFVCKRFDPNRLSKKTSLLFHPYDEIFGLAASSLTSEVIALGDSRSTASRFRKGIRIMTVVPAPISLRTSS